MKWMQGVDGRKLGVGLVVFAAEGDAGLGGKSEVLFWTH